MQLIVHLSAAWDCAAAAAAAAATAAMPANCCACMCHGAMLQCKLLRLEDVHVLLAGYGNSAPNDCWWATVFIVTQTLLGLFLDCMTIGIIFARISHPKNRGRTIGISDSCCISRRDGILKLMFRIADFRKTQVAPVCAAAPGPQSALLRPGSLVEEKQQNSGCTASRAWAAVGSDWQWQAAAAAAAAAVLPDAMI